MTQILSPLIQTGIVNNSQRSEILTRPVINFFPSSSSVNDGEVLVICVGATGGNLTYQWQLSTDGGTVWNDLAGEDGKCLEFGPVDGSDDGSMIRVIVSNENGDTYSPPTTVTVVAVGPGAPLTMLLDNGNVSPILPDGVVNWIRNQDGDEGGTKRGNGFLHMTWEDNDPRPSGLFPDGGEGYYFAYVTSNDWDQSENFAHASTTRTNVSVGSSGVDNPSEDLPGDTDSIIEDSSTAEHSVSQVIPNGSLGTWYFSVFARQLSGNRHIRLELSGDSIDPDAWVQFDLTDGSIQSQGADVHQARSQLYEAGSLNWWHVMITSAQRGIAGDVTCLAKMLDGSFNQSYAGDGSSSLALFGAHAYNGFMGAGLQAYPRATGAANVDLQTDVVNLSSPASAFPQWNQPYSVFVAYQFPGGPAEFGGQLFFGLNDTSFSAFMFGGIGDDGNAFDIAAGNAFILNSGDGSGFDGGETDLGPAGQQGSIAITSDGVTTRFFKDGVFVISRTHGATANLTGNIDFNALGGSEATSGYAPYILRKFQIYDSELSDSEIQFLHDEIFNP